MKLVIACIECGNVVHATFDDDKLKSRQLYQEHGWVLSVIDPKEQVLAPLCGPCAERVYPPELLKVVKQKFSKPS